MKLIFVEGVSGVGKSTLTRKLFDELNEKGYSTICYIEGDFQNPIDFYSTAYFNQVQYDNLLMEYHQLTSEIRQNTVYVDDIRLIRYYDRELPLYTKPLLNILRQHDFLFSPADYISISEYARVYKSVWKQFAREIGDKYEYMIFDGSLFHHPINDMIRNYNATIHQIAQHLNTLIRIVNLLNPRLIYLSSDNVAERLQRARMCRNQSPPSEEKIRFWERRKQMDLAVMQFLSIPYNVYDISGENWNEHLDAIIKTCIE